MNKKSNAEYLGEYILSLPIASVRISGSRLKAIRCFLSSSPDFSKKGWLEFKASNKGFLTDLEFTYIRDFLYFCGVKTGQTRKDPYAKVVQPLSEVSEANKQRVVAFLNWCDKQREYSQSSIRMKRDHMTKFFRYFSEFNNENCRSFIKTMEADNLSPKTLNVYILTLMQYGEFVKKKVSLKKISIPTSLSVENVPTVREYNSFLCWLKENSKWFCYWIIKTLGMTGMRLSELQQLRWCDILLGEFYPRCKGKKHRLIYFPKTLIDELKEWIKDNPTDINSLVITKQNGLPKKNIGQHLRLMASKAGFPREKAHCHAFRHFFAKQYLAKTKDVIQLAELLGHESVDTTRLYLQKSKAEQRRDINRNIDW